MCLDALHAIIWQNGGGKGRRPKPVSPLAAKPRRTQPDESLTQEQIWAMLTARAPNQEQVSDG